MQNATNVQPTNATDIQQVLKAMQLKKIKHLKRNLATRLAKLPPLPVKARAVAGVSNSINIAGD